MWAANGIIAIPSDPQIKKTQPTTSNKGRYINFKCVTEGQKRGEDANYQHWNASMWVPEDQVAYWEEQLTPGSVFHVGHAYLTSFPILEGKYHNTVVRIDYNKIKKFEQPMWAKR